MTETLTIGGLDFNVKRSPRRKTVRVTIERDRRLCVYAPENADIARLAEIVEGRLLWVHQKLLKLPDPPIPQPVFRPKDIVDGEGFHFLGRHYRLKIVDKPKGDRATLPVYLDGQFLCLRSEFVKDGERQITKFYTREAHPYLNDCVAHWKQHLGAEPQPFVHVQDLGYRWGSCSADGTLNFHWRVMHLPSRAIDYVVVHELCHFKVSDHSPLFWEEVRRVMPDYEAQRRWMRDYGGRL